MIQIDKKSPVLTAGAIQITIIVDVDIAIVGGPREGDGIVGAHATSGPNETPSARNRHRVTVIELKVRTRVILDPGVVSPIVMLFAWGRGKKLAKKKIRERESFRGQS